MTFAKIKLPENLNGDFKQGASDFTDSALSAEFYHFGSVKAYPS